MYEVPGEIPMTTQEGPGVWHEAIEFLRTQPSKPALVWNDKLAKAADWLAEDLSASNSIGRHARRYMGMMSLPINLAGSDGTPDHVQIDFYGQWESTVAENVSGVFLPHFV